MRYQPVKMRLSSKNQFEFCKLFLKQLRFLYNMCFLFHCIGRLSQFLCRNTCNLYLRYLENNFPKFQAMLVLPIRFSYIPNNQMLVLQLKKVELSFSFYPLFFINFNNELNAFAR